MNHSLRLLIVIRSIYFALSYSPCNFVISRQNFNNVPFKYQSAKNSRTGILTACSAHMSASYPHVSFLSDDERDLSIENTFNSREDDPNILETLCSLLRISAPELYLSNGKDGERGVYTQKDIKKDDIIMSVPLSSCIRDDNPPSWLQGEIISESNSLHSQVFDPSKWATRLASLLIEKKLSIQKLDPNSDNSLKDTGVEVGFQKWLESMPNPEFLRASLPVHWSEDTILNTKCKALELAVDSSYFARGEAAHDLIQSLNEALEVEDQKMKKKTLEGMDLERICQDILDIVQTRCCRLDAPGGAQWGPPLRVLAPVFDFINHGSSKALKGKGYANAYYGLEKNSNSEENSCIVVRARTNIFADEEILVDYGESAHPAWRCLVSYGFVPEYDNLLIDDSSDDTEVEDVAEVYMNGRRFEVGTSTIPAELVETAHESLLLEQTDFPDPEQYEEYNQSMEKNFIDNQHDGTLLSPIVATRLAERISDASFALLLHNEPEEIKVEQDDSFDCPKAIISERLAAALRWSQHRVLRDCAESLRDYAKE